MREEAGKTALAAYAQLLLDMGYWPSPDRNNAEFDAIVRSFPEECVAVGPDLGNSQLPPKAAYPPDRWRARGRVVVDWWYMPTEEDRPVLWLKSPIDGVDIQAVLDAARERIRHCRRTGKTGKATLGQAIRWVIAHPTQLQGMAAFRHLK